MTTPLTILYSARTVAHQLNGGETELDIPFPVLPSGENGGVYDVVVYRRRADVEVELAPITDYTVTGIGLQAGAKVILAAPALAGDIVVIDGDRVPQRITNFQQHRSLRSTEINDELNRQAVLLQEMRRDYNRALTRQPTALPNVGGYDAAGYQIVNLAPGVADTDAATVGQVAPFAAAAEAAKLAAEASAAAAEAAKSAAEAAVSTAGDGPINVIWFDAVGDDDTDNTAALTNAVAAAISAGAELYWPPGTYLTTGNIPGFHSVRHSGPGAIKRGSRVWYIEPKESDRNTLYVETDGDNSSDGLSPDEPMATLQQAFDVLQATWVRAMCDGFWGVDLGAGTWSGGAEWLSAVKVKHRFRVRGADASGGPATTILDGTSNNAVAGIYFQYGTDYLHIKDIDARHFTLGSVANGFKLDKCGEIFLENCYADDCGYAGFYAGSVKSITVQGGEYSNCSNGGIVYANSRFSVGSSSARVKFTDCSAAGLLIQGAYGHADYCDYDGCSIGLIAALHGHSTNHYSTFTDCAVGWQQDLSGTISTSNETLTNTTVRSRSRYSPATGDASQTLYDGQFWERLGGSTGRWAHGYSAGWVQPVAKFQWAADTPVGFSRSGATGAVAIWENGGANLYNVMLAPSSNYSSLWFGDETAANRAQLRHQNAILSFMIGSTAILGVTSNAARPGTDNTLSLGTSSLKWSVVYAGTGTINTSDERDKQDVIDATEDEAAIRAIRKVKIRRYRWRDAVAKKGDGARLHFGAIAQEIKAAFESEGLDAFAYGLLCYDEWDEEPEQIETWPDQHDEDGNLVRAAGSEVVTPHRPAGNRYGVRYDELLALKIAALES